MTGMINIDFTNIDNAKLVGRLLPFWARGRRIQLLVQALLEPLVPLQQSFKGWALKAYIACHITAQKASLEWYLKYCLKSHFHNPEDEFMIAKGKDILACFSNDIWTNEYNWSNTAKWGVEIPVKEDETVVYAPQIVDTVNYNHDDYKRDIRNIMSKYMINFKKINIIVAEY